MHVNVCCAGAPTMESWRRRHVVISQAAEAARRWKSIMIRDEGRIVTALGAVFVTLGGIDAAQRGLLFDETAVRITASSPYSSARRRSS